VPQYQCELWYLFALLAQFQKSRLPCILIQQIRNEVQRAPILFRNILHHTCVLTVCWIYQGWSGSVVVGSNPIVVLLISCCMRGLGSMLMVGLLVHPCWLALGIVLMLMGKDVSSWEHRGRSRSQRDSGGWLGDVVDGTDAPDSARLLVGIAVVAMTSKGDIMYRV
jgi:hypothetical protein